MILKEWILSTAGQGRHFPFGCCKDKALNWARLTLKSPRTKGQTFEKPHRHRCCRATTHLVGSWAKRDGCLEAGQASTDGALSLFLLHRWTQSHLVHSPMPYSCKISVSVFTCLTCLLSDKNGCLASPGLALAHGAAHEVWHNGFCHVEMSTFYQSIIPLRPKWKLQGGHEPTGMCMLPKPQRGHHAN